jgi:hypothetical protein
LQHIHSQTIDLVIMVSLASAFVGALAALGATAAPLTDLVKRATTPNAQGTSGGFFYQFCECAPNSGKNRAD